ncbi:MAG: putative er of superfamily [Pseudomonadota bacterium]
MTARIPIPLQPVLLLVASNVFLTYSAIHRQQPLKLDCLWAALCLPGAVHFIFRS